MCGFDGFNWCVMNLKFFNNIPVYGKLGMLMFSPVFLILIASYGQIDGKLESYKAIQTTVIVRSLLTQISVLSQNLREERAAAIRYAQSDDFDAEEAFKDSIKKTKISRKQSRVEFRHLQGTGVFKKALPSIKKIVAEMILLEDVRDRISTDHH